MCSITVKELKSICKAMNIRGYSKLRKAELINLIQEQSNIIIEENQEQSNIEEKVEDAECPICMCEIKNKITTKCGHSFCETCIKTWCKNHSTCPLCRGDIQNEICPELKEQPLHIQMEIAYREILSTLNELHF
jgi:hypothetical protein